MILTQMLHERIDYVVGLKKAYTLVVRSGSDCLLWS